MDTPNQSPTCISFCYGIGGLDAGLERVVGPVQHLCIVEIEAVLAANVVKKMEANEMAPCPVWTDVKTFPAQLFRDRVDFLLGGYPCTPFSLAGKRKGTDDPRHLWTYFERAIQAIRPVCCIFENVDDHLTLGFPDVYCSLRAMGYSVEVGVYSAEEVGAPHERQRMFIIAVDDSNRGRFREQIRQVSAGRNTAEFSGEELEHSNKSRPQGWNGRVSEERSREWTTGTSSAWPSRPGEPQHGWEAPRTINRATESAVGLSVDGFSFREDFLRALGNAVVQQTAEKAIRDLIGKF